MVGKDGKDIQKELVSVADVILKKAEELTRLLSLETPTVTGGGTSPVILSDGSLYITSIADAISGPTAVGDGTFTYLIEKHSPLIVARHCSGSTKPNGDNWKLTIPLLGGGPIEVKQVDADHIKVTGVPTAVQPVNAAVPGENVLTMNVTPDWSNATFDPNTLNSAPKLIGRHSSLHFSSKD